MSKGKDTPLDLKTRQEITNNINGLMRRFSTSQVELSEKTGIPKSTLSGYMNGKSTPTSENMESIARYFGVEIKMMDPRYNDNKPTNAEKQDSEISAADILGMLMNQHKVKPDAMARHIGVTQEQLSDILNRKAFMSFEIAKNIQIATGLSAKALLETDLNYRIKKTQFEISTGVTPFDWADEQKIIILGY